MSPSLIPRLLTGLAMSTLAAAAITCPEEDIVATQCAAPKDCLYPNPNDCRSFIACDVNADGKTGRPTVLDCPSGLEWNDDQKECDWPADSTCGAVVQETLDTAKEALPPADGEVDSSFDCDGAKEEQGCESEVECIYANPKEEGSYVQCTSGTAYVVKCESGLSYSDAIKACV